MVVESLARGLGAAEIGSVRRAAHLSLSSLAFCDSNSASLMAPDSLAF